MFPVDISKTNAGAAGGRILYVHDSAANGLFLIDSTTSPTGDALVRFSNPSGIVINPAFGTAPAYTDPYTDILSFNPPAPVGGNITAAANIGAATSANYVYTYNLATVVPAIPTPANTVTRVKIIIVGHTNTGNAMFSMEVNGRLAPNSSQQVLLGSVSSELDSSLAGLTVDVVYTANAINFALIGGPVPGTTAYKVTGTAIITLIKYA